MRTIYLVRHGTPVTAEEKVLRFIGVTDAPLSETGRQECEKTGKWFQDKGFSGRIYASPLARASDTAKIIAEELMADGVREKAEISVIDDLREIDYGDCENLTYRQILRRFPVRSLLWIIDFYHQSFPGGESFWSCGKRFEAAIRRILDENRDNQAEILIASHSFVIESFLILTGNLKVSHKILTSPVPCASVTTVLVDETGTFLATTIGEEVSKGVADL